MNDTDDAPRWGDILQEPFVGLILGQRGSGKTALGHRLLEVFGHPDNSDRDAYILGFPPATFIMIFLVWLIPYFLVSVVYGKFFETDMISPQELRQLENELKG